MQIVQKFTFLYEQYNHTITTQSAHVQTTLTRCSIFQNAADNIYDSMYDNMYDNESPNNSAFEHFSVTSHKINKISWKYHNNVS